MNTFTLYLYVVPMLLMCWLLANVPSQPENVRLSMTSSGHVLVSWDAPRINGHLVQVYLVEYTAEHNAQLATSSSLVGGLDISEDTI